MSLRTASRPARRRARGVSMVEFAIVFPVAVLFVLGIIQTGFFYMAKLTLNHATFVAARAGAMHNASQSVMKEAMVRGLGPFYQDSTETNLATRLVKARVPATKDSALYLTLDTLSPSADAFSDFGIKDGAKKVTYIPNDHLEWRDLTPGSKSKVNIRDANLLKLRVVYGYEMKVPFIGHLMKRMMCGGSTGPKAWGNVNFTDAMYATSKPDLCARYFLLDPKHPRIPIESIAIVEMQSPAYQP